VPYIILGDALLVLFASLGFERSLWTVAIAHTIVSLPYTLLVIMARMVGFDKHLEEQPRTWAPATLTRYDALSCR